MGESNGFTFRSAGLGGFNKKDVIAYIEMLTVQFREKEASDKQAYASLEKENLSLRDSYDALLLEFNTVKSELVAQAELEKQIESKQSENERLTHRVDELSAENERLSTQLKVVEENLSDHVADLNTLNLEKQAITELELAAKLRAAQIEKESREKISLMVDCCQQGFDQATEAFTAFTQTSSEMIHSACQQLDAINALFSDVNDKLMQSRSNIDRLAKDFPQKNSSIDSND